MSSIDTLEIFAVLVLGRKLSLIRTILKLFHESKCLCTGMWTVLTIVQIFLCWSVFQFKFMMFFC